MPNQKDLLQAHRLMTQRAALALIAGDPDSPDQPLRRRTTLTVCGLLAGVIAVAAFGVLGLLSPGTVNGLTAAGTLVIDKNTEALYVPCLGQELCPSLNYASALLALDTPNVNQVHVTQSTLSHYRIGPMIGIAGLPQDLPTSGDLFKGPWAVCASSDVSTLVGGVSVGGTPLAAGSAALVTAAGGDWVLWHGERLAIVQDVMLALFSGVTPTAVPEGWLDAIPQGPDFAAPMITGQGGPVTGPEGPAHVGQVYDEPGSAGIPTVYYVLTDDGELQTVTQAQFDLLRLEYGAAQISPAQATGHVASTPLPRGGLPSAMPHLAANESPVCVTYGPGVSHSITTGGAIPAGAVSVPAAGGSGGSGGSGSGSAAGGSGGSGGGSAAATGNGAPSVDLVWLPPGKGALVGDSAGANSSSRVASWFLVSGASRYALSASGQSPSDVAAALGYNLSADETVLPASVVDLLPEGPVLNPGAATTQAAG